MSSLTGGWYDCEEIVDYAQEYVMGRELKPVHPGEILREEFMKPLGLSMNRMAMDRDVRPLETAPSR